MQNPASRRNITTLKARLMHSHYNVMRLPATRRHRTAWKTGSLIAAKLSSSYQKTAAAPTHLFIAVVSMPEDSVGIGIDSLQTPVVQFSYFK